MRFVDIVFGNGGGSVTGTGSSDEDARQKAEDLLSRFPQHLEYPVSYISEGSIPENWNDPDCQEDGVCEKMYTPVDRKFR